MSRSSSISSANLRLTRGESELIDCTKAPDADGAVQVIAKYVSNCGCHIMERMHIARPSFKP
jgi:hypothetical protein